MRLCCAAHMSLAVQFSGHLLHAVACAAVAWCRRKVKEEGGEEQDGSRKKKQQQRPAAEGPKGRLKELGWADCMGQASEAGKLRLGRECGSAGGVYCAFLCASLVWCRRPGRGM